MQKQKVLQVGSQLGIALPQSLVRAEGWCRGDRVAIFLREGDIVIRNDTKRSARFSHDQRGRRDERIAAESR